MKRINITLLMTVVFALALSFTARAQTDETNTLVETWLLKNCDAGEELQLQNQIVEMGTELEPVFLEAYNSGPNAELVAEIESAAGNSYDRRAKMLESGETFGLSEENLEIAKAETREDYINREKEAFVMRYKSQALSGLGLVGDQSGYEILKEVSQDADSPLQVTAQQALKNIKYEEPEPDKSEDGEPKEAE